LPGMEGQILFSFSWKHHYIGDASHSCRFTGIYLQSGFHK
jgi:hypothetical protein